MDEAPHADRPAPPFGALLHHYRAAEGFTQKQLAARAGLSRDAIAALESGKRHIPRAATVELLADALELDAPGRAQLVDAARVPATTEYARRARTVERGPADAGGRATWRPAAEPTPLVDRAEELDTIVRLLTVEDVRLLTLTGAAGVGRTRVALAAAARLARDGAARFPDGVTIVDLTPCREVDVTLSRIAAALGLLDLGSRSLLDRLNDALRERKQLVVLDNFEQIVAAAVQLADVLAACPGLALLVTSRIPLRLRWEHELEILPLPVPDPTAPLPPLDELTAIPSVALFLERVRARQPNFVLSDQDAPIVARMVTQLDGLPLALELAAARVAMLSLQVIVHRLGDRLRLLHWEAPDMPARQRSLAAAVGWSYGLLSPPERRLFRCLGVFVGRVTLHAIAAVARVVASKTAGAERDDVRTLAHLASLAEQGLILPVRAADPGWLQQGAEDAEDEAAEPAFGMLETVREYAAERLTARDFEAASRAHAHYFLALAERADPELRGPYQRAWFFRLERDVDNLRVAIRWLLDREDPSEREAALRLCGALGFFMWARGYHAEGTGWLEEALRRAPADADAEVRARALRAAGWLLTYRNEQDHARAMLEEALALAHQQQDAAGIAQSLTSLGLRAIMAGEMAEAARVLDEARARWDVPGQVFYRSLTLVCLGAVAFAQGHYAQAEALESEALEQLTVLGDARLAGFAHCYLAILMWKRGDLAGALEHVHAGVQASVTLRDRWLLSCGARAAVALVTGHANATQCARLLGVADALSQATSSTPSLFERLPNYPDLAPLRERLEGEERGAAYQNGRTLPFAAGAALALRVLEDVASVSVPRAVAPESSQQPEQPSEQGPLSAREREVLRLVAQGRSSKIIGRQLFLSPSTINQNLTAIFHKLGVNTRAQAVAVAVRRGLL